MEREIAKSGTDHAKAKEPSKFDQIESRITQVTARVSDVAFDVRGTVDDLNGPDVQPDKGNDVSGKPEAVLDRIGYALMLLENVTTELEIQRERLRGIV